MLISFIIPHKGREELLEKTVASIVAQDYDDLNQVEIIIVTQNTTLPFDFRREKELVSMKIVFQHENETISALRNKGADYSSGDYLAFLDADVALSPNWISTMLSELNEDAGRVLVSAAQRYENNASSVEKIRTALCNMDVDTEVRFLPGPNLLLKKVTFMKAGGFPENLATCEDYYFTDQVHMLGQLYYSSKAGFVHLGEDKNYKELFNKEIWRAQSNLQSVKGRRIPLSELPSFLVPIWILVFVVMIIVASALTAIEYMMVGIVLLMLPLLLYTIRLYMKVDKKISFVRVAQFYLVYFSARAIGTVLGLFKAIKV